MDTIMEVEDLYFRYEERDVLQDINLKIERGSFVSIIGPNGSGKTTLLRNMTSILPPLTGRVLLKGKDIGRCKKRDLARCLAFVPQNTMIDFGFTVMDVVLMGRAPYLGSFQSETVEDIRIAEEAMEMTNTLGFKDKKVTEISGGERQRAVIACALAQTPEIILLDEPVSNLDIQHQLEVLGILKSLNRKNNMTVVVVLHDLNLAAEYSDTIILMKDGKLIHTGTPAQVITEDNISSIYKTSIYMIKNPVSGNPHIIPLSRACG